MPIGFGHVDTTRHTQSANQAGEHIGKQGTIPPQSPIPANGAAPPTNKMMTIKPQRQRWFVLTAAMVIVCLVPSFVFAKGEPAEAFVKQLRNAGYFDTAISFLDRAKSNPSVDASFIKAIPLEKAQTYIDSALSTRDREKQDAAFADAETSLQAFLKQGEHPRTNEARLQLGKLQMIRAAQLLSGEPTAEKRTLARNSYINASKTFDGIVETHRATLQEMQGQKIDAESDPDAAARRDQYRFEFLQAQANAADAIKLAANTFEDPAKDAKTQLEDAAKRFTDLNKKYAKWPPGAIALMHLGQINETLGKYGDATDNFLNMLEQSEADPLRDAKFLAAAGFIRLKLRGDEPKYKEAIERTEGWVKDIRPNERSSASVQEFRLALAKAYLAKAADDSLKKGEIGRAKSDGRKLLQEAIKVPGVHQSEVESLLASLGIEQEETSLPTAEPPKSFDDAMEKAREIIAIVDGLEKARDLLTQQKANAEQLAETETQIRESYAIGIQILRAGLVMVNSETSIESINQARQILTYFLYQSKLHRDTVVVGSFLARQAPNQDPGLKGGLMALTSLQMLLGEVPDDENGGLIRQLESLGKYMSTTWPDNEQAAAAQGIQIRLLLKKDDFEGAEALITKMPASSERASFKRLLGQLLWNESIKALTEQQDEAQSDRLRKQATKLLTEGLDEIEGNLIEMEGVAAASILAKLHLLAGNSKDSLDVLDHPKYGPLKQTERLGEASEAFRGDLYSTELKSLVGQMLSSDDPGQYLDRMTSTMEKLRETFTGPEAKGKLTQTYKGLARDLRDQLDQAAPDRKGKLIEAFRVLLKRIADSTDDGPTLRWGGQTLMSMGESLMTEGQLKAEGQAAELISQAASTFETLKERDATTLYLLGKAKRLIGEYKASIDTLAEVLTDKPNMIEAQFEAAQAYESWAGALQGKTAYKAYTVAIKGGRKNPKGKNTIWGWEEISVRTKDNPAFSERFFDARYHVNLCLMLMGKALDRKSEARKAVSDIRKLLILRPDLYNSKLLPKYDALMKECQRQAGEAVTGIPPKPQPKQDS